MAIPWAYRDEACYLINAASLIGYVTDSPNSYPTGYSILLAPIFGILRNPDHIFLAATVMNAGLASMLFLSLYSFLKIFAMNSKFALATATTVSLYAPIWVYANQAMPEILIGVVYILSMQCLYIAINGRRANDFMRFAALASFMPLIHYRTAPVTFVAWAVLVTSFRAGAIRIRQFFYCMSVSGLVLFLGFGSKLVSDNRLSLVGNMGDKHYLLEAHKILGSFLAPLDSLGSFLGSMAGQVLYLGVASCGFTIMGAILSIRYSRIKSSEPRSNAVLLYYFILSFGGCFLVSCLSKILPNLQDQFVFGRYNDLMSLPVMAMGIILFLNDSSDTRKRTASLAILMIMLAGIVLLVTRGNELDALQGSRIRYFNISAISVVVYVLGNVQIQGIVVYGLSMTLLLAMLCCKSPKYFFPLFGLVLFLNAGFAVYLSNEDGLRRRNSPGINTYSTSNIVHLLRTHEKLIAAALNSGPCQKCINYDLESQNVWFKWHYRWQLYDWTLLASSNPRSNPLGSLLTISGQENAVKGGRLLTRESNLDQYLIISPGEANQKLLSYHLGDLIDFSRSGNSFRYQSNGWAAPEQFGVSMNGPEACLTLMPTHSEGAVRLIALIHFPENFNSTLDVQVNGAHLAFWKAESKEQFTARISEVHFGTEQVTICFRVLGDLPSASGKQMPIFKSVRLVQDNE